MLQETLKWLSNPASQIDPNVPPPGLENWDPIPYLAASLPITVSVFATQLAHEIGHRVMAALRRVRCLCSCNASRCHLASRVVPLAAAFAAEQAGGPDSRCCASRLVLLLHLFLHLFLSIVRRQQQRC